MKFAENDIVKVKINKETARVGDIGTIVCVFDKPNEAYEVEIVNEDGTTKLLAVFLPNELEKHG